MSAETKIQVGNLLGRAKSLANEYYQLTGRPLGIAGEIAEFEAIRILGLTPAKVRQAGFGACESTERGTIRVQIKGRCFKPGAPIQGDSVGSN